MTNKRFIVWVLIGGALLRLIVFVLQQPWSQDAESRFVCDDAVGYWILAKNLVFHGAFSRMEHEPFVPDALRTPGYPIFVAAVCGVFGFKVGSVFIVQGLLNLGVIWLLYKACLMVLDDRTAKIAAILSAMDIYAMEFNNMLWTESLSLFTIAAILYIVALIMHTGRVDTRMIWLLIALGAITGLSVLVHPRATNLIGVLILMLCVARLTKLAIKDLPLQHLGWIILGWALVISPWVVRNFIAYGSLGISSASDLGLYFTSLPATMARVDGITYREAQAKYPAPEDHGGGVGPGAMSLADGAYYRKYSVEILKAHPLDAAIAHLQGMLRMFRRVDGMIGGNCEKPADRQIEYYKVLKQGGVRALFDALRSDPDSLNSVFFGLHLAFLFTVYSGIIVALCYLHTLHPQQRMFVLIVAAVTFYFNVLCGPLGGVRHRIPMHPGLEIIASVGIAHLFTISLKRLFSRRIAA